MRVHYLLELNQIQNAVCRRVVRTPEGSWVIDLRPPRQGFCPTCRTRSRARKGCGHRDIQGLGAEGIPVLVRLRWQDFYCPNPGCPKVTFRVLQGEQYGGPRHLTIRAVELIRQLWIEHGQNNCEVVRFLKQRYAIRTSESTVRRLCLRSMTSTRGLYAPQHLGIDEIYPLGLKKEKGRGRPVTRSRIVLVDLDTGQILGLERGMDHKAAERLLDWASRRYDLTRVEDVTRDLNLAWDQALHRYLDRPGHRLEIRVDRFHLIRNLLKSIYAVYTHERTRLRELGRIDSSRELFHNRYRFRKRRRRLLEADREHKTSAAGKLDAMLGRHPKLDRLYRLKEDLYRLLDLEGSDLKAFGQLFGGIVEQAESMGLHDLADRLVRHRSFIEANQAAPATHYLPEQCFVAYRAAERRRKSFRTDAARAVYVLAKTAVSLNALMSDGYRTNQAERCSTT